MQLLDWHRELLPDWQQAMHGFRRVHPERTHDEAFDDDFGAHGDGEHVCRTVSLQVDGHFALGHRLRDRSGQVFVLTLQHDVGQGAGCSHDLLTHVTFFCSLFLQQQPLLEQFGRGRDLLQQQFRVEHVLGL